MDKLAAFGEQAGFTVIDTVVDGSDVVEANGVLCLLKNGGTSTCVIQKSYDPQNGQPDERIGGAVHAVRIRTDEEQDGRVYQADGKPIGNRVDGDKRSWSNISIKKGSQARPEDDLSARDLVHRYAKQIVGAVSAAGCSDTAALTAPTPFKIPNTYEARSQMRLIQDRIRDTSVAIIGAGGTGSYILDLIAKTPVNEIHLLDSDDINWHNFMRAPGAPTKEALRSIQKHKSQGLRPLLKVDYYHSKYAPLRDGINPHRCRVESLTQFNEFLQEHSIDFAFVCIDQTPNGCTSRQDVVYNALSQNKIPFIDSGVSITLNEEGVTGSVTTSAYSDGSQKWQQMIPNAAATGGRPGYRNIQLPEVNALAASLAVMEWRRQTGQYISKSKAGLHKFKTERPSIVSLETERPDNVSP